MKKLLRSGFATPAAIILASLLVAGAMVFAPSSVTAVSCAVYDGNQTTCQATTGCTWDANVSCSAFDGDSSACTGTSGCTWDSTSCTGPTVNPDCTNQNDAYGGSCALNETQTNCSWADPDCSGDVACDAGDATDQATCEAITYGSGIYQCDGTYNTNTCSGTYAPGTCSGTYGTGSCSIYAADQTTCQATSGCSWDAATCSAYSGDQSACQAQVECTYPGNLGDCGIYSSDEPTCTATSGCTPNTTPCSWADPDCSGDVACDAGDATDQATCEAITYFSCSGNYDDGTCSGDGCSGTFDTTAPTVTNITSATANGSYNAGDAISIQITFSEPVNVAGTPQLTLETGDTDRAVNYSSGTGGLTLTFAYTVQSGDTAADLDYTGTSALALNGGTIKDPSLNAATLTLPSPGAAGSLGANKALVIDTTGPTVALTAPADGASVAGASVTVSADASDGGTGVAGVQFKRNTNTAIGAEDTTSTYGVTWNTTGLSDGSQTLIAVARDAAGNYATSTSRTVTVDNTAPTVLNASSTAAAGAYNEGDTIDIDIQFAEAVTSTGLVTVTLETGTTDRTCTFSVSAATYGTCDYTVSTVTSNDTSADLTVGSISGTIADAAGNAMTSFAPATNLAANEAIVIDTTAPTITLDAPLDAAVVAGAAVALTATPADTNLVGVQFKVDGTNEGAEDTAAAYGVTWDSTAVIDGAYTLAAVARDTAGNYATDTAAVTVTNAVASGGGSRPSVTTYTYAPGYESAGEEDDDADDDEGEDQDDEDEDETPEEGDEAGAEGPAYSFPRDLEAGVEGPDVRDLQRFLNARGFTVAPDGPGAPGNETDLFGERTRAALAAFQLANGITPAAGYLGPVTRALIAGIDGAAPAAAPAPAVLGAAAAPAFPRDLELGDTGEDVRSLQVFLNARGFTVAGAGPGSPGQETAMFGYATRAALARFQAASGISPAAGYLGPRTRAAVAGF
ncbi:MAG TPA: Ig-like domain-containing protein [Candidatus Paceibacterota bacterium]